MKDSSDDPDNLNDERAPGNGTRSKGKTKMTTNKSNNNTTSAAGATVRGVDITDQIFGAFVVPDEPDAIKPRYEILHAANFFEPQAPIEWTVDGLISDGSVSVVFGEPGCGKTWALFDLAVCVARGDAWLNMATKAGAVLIVDEESGRRRLSRRMGEVMRGHDAGPDTPVMGVSLAAFDLGNDEDIKEIRALIIRNKIKMVIIDALADVMPGRDENAVKDTAPIFLSLRKIAEETQAAIIVIHHSNKGGGYRGSSSIKGAIDLLLNVEKKNESNNMTFRTEKARDTTAGAFGATMNFDNDKFWLTASEYDRSAALYKNGELYVMRYLKASGTGTMIDIQGSADNCSEEMARKSVYKLINLGIVERTNAGGRGVAAIYKLTDKGNEAANNGS